MTRQLDLADIQGNVVRDYGGDFPKARFFFLHIGDTSGGRAFVDALRPKVTTAVRWRPDKDYPGDLVQPMPKVAINIAFTFYGLLALGLPTGTLGGMPSEFIDGMAKRAHILGDQVGQSPNKPDRRDPIWQAGDDADTRVHVMVSMSAQMNPDGTHVAELDAETGRLNELCDRFDLTVLSGHAGDDLHYQNGSLLLAKASGRAVPTAKEHFGFTDGFGNPTFEGQHHPEAEHIYVIGGGKIAADQSWQALATGEFLLGHPDEAQEIPGAAMPLDFSRNGTFVAYRKLHQNVGSFNAYMADTATTYAKVMGVSGEIAGKTLRAKMAGRWPDGVPTMAAPTYDDWKAFNARCEKAERTKDARELEAIQRAYVDFKYRDDPDGLKCPVTAHIRRANTRDMLDPALRSTDPKKWNGSVLNNRRRIVRRGRPYGSAAPDTRSDDGEHGIIFLAVCASLFRQFEFVQQQWIQYGLDLNAGNDTCPLLGNRDEDAKFVIASDPASGKPPFICNRLPQFVECRGGDYFFVPSMTALRMIGMGTIDPT